MPEQRHPDLGRISSRMAANLSKVAEYADALASRIDDLVAATAQRDWKAVEQASRQLAESSRAEGYRAISALSERVRLEAAKPDNALGIKRSVIRLIGTCGRVKAGPSHKATTAG